MSLPRTKNSKRSRMNKNMGQYLIWKLNHECIRSTHTHAHSILWARKRRKLYLLTFNFKMFTIRFVCMHLCLNPKGSNQLRTSGQIECTSGDEKKKEKHMHYTNIIRMILKRSFKNRQTNKLKVRALSSQTFSFFCYFCELFFLDVHMSRTQKGTAYVHFPLANLTFAFACMHIKFAVTCNLVRRLLKTKEFPAMHFT